MSSWWIFYILIIFDTSPFFCHKNNIIDRNGFATPVTKCLKSHFEFSLFHKRTHKTNGFRRAPHSRMTF